MQKFSGFSPLCFDVVYLMWTHLFVHNVARMYELPVLLDKDIDKRVQLTSTFINIILYVVASSDFILTAKVSHSWWDFSDKLSHDTIFTYIPPLV